MALFLLLHHQRRASADLERVPLSCSQPPRQGDDQNRRLQTKVPEDYAKFHNHKEGPHKGLLLVESAR